MNILMTNRELDIGGGNTFLRNFAAVLSANGHKCFLVAGNGDTLPLQRKAFEKVCIRNLTLPWDHIWLTRFIQKHRIQLVNAHALIQLPVITRACCNTRTPMVLTLAAPFPAKRVERYLPFAEGVMVMNEYQRDYYIKMGAKPESLFRTYWMMNWDVFESGAKKWEEREFDAVYCSRLSSTKAPLAIAFLQASKRMLRDYPKMRVAVIGNGRHLSKVQQALKEFNAAAKDVRAKLFTEVLDSAPYFQNSRTVAGGNYVCIEGLAAGANVVGAGYDGVFGVVDASNLLDATDQYFGDHITPITGEERVENQLANRFETSLRKALSAKPDPDIQAKAKGLFRREDVVVDLEKEFMKAMSRMSR